MTPDDRLDARLTAGLTDLVGTSAPDYRNDILRQVARTRQRPSWTFPERWIPMTLLVRSGAPVRPFRQTWLFLAIVALMLALVAGLAVAGARLLLPQPPDKGFHALISVPVLDLADTWDATTITGLSNPNGMDIGPDGNLYVVNGGTDEILVIDPSGTVVNRWGARGSGPGQFDFQVDPFDPTVTEGGVSVGADGSVYVADLANDRVQQLTANGAPVRQWGSYGTDDGQFLNPLDLAVGPDGSVYVVDDRRDDIQQFTPDGTFTTRIGSHGTGDGQLNSTGYVSVDAAGTLLNADYGNDRVQAWGPDGAFLWSLGAPGGDVPWTGPIDVGADLAGNLYVTDVDGLKVFGPERELLTSWTPPAAANKEKTYFVAVSRDGNVFLASPANSRIYQVSVTSHEVEVSPTPSAPVTPAPSSAAGETSPGPSATGTLLTVDHTFAVPFTLDLPPGWAQNPLSRGEVQARFRRGPDSTPAYVVVSIPINVFADPCHPEAGPMSPPVGPTVDDLTYAVTHAVGFRSGPITDVTIDGYHGKTFELDNNIDITTCADPIWLRQWTLDSSTGGAQVVTNNADLPDAHQRIAILDVKGTRVLVSTWTFRGTTLADEERQADHVFDSIHFQ